MGMKMNHGLTWEYTKNWKVDEEIEKIKDNTTKKGISTHDKENFVNTIEKYRDYMRVRIGNDIHADVNC